MNFDVFILFFNAVITTVLSSVIVIWILRKQYLPTIRRLESEASSENDRKADPDSSGENEEE